MAWHRRAGRLLDRRFGFHPGGDDGALVGLRQLWARHHAFVCQSPGPLCRNHLLVWIAARHIHEPGIGPIQKTMANINVPISVHGETAGTAQLFQKSFANMPFLLLAAILTIYITLGVLYESLIHPVTIISTLPSAGVGRGAGAADVQDAVRPDRHDRCDSC